MREIVKDWREALIDAFSEAGLNAEIDVAWKKYYTDRDYLTASVLCMDEGGILILSSSKSVLESDVEDMDIISSSRQMAGSIARTISEKLLA